jgi:hypothetical protein
LSELRKIPLPSFFWLSFTQRRLEAKVTTVGPTATKVTRTPGSERESLIENLVCRKEDPYLSIDMAMFDIVPAVPGVNIPYQDNRGTTMQPAINQSINLFNLTLVINKLFFQQIFYIKLQY